MTTILRYTGLRTADKGPIKLGDFPDYDGKLTEIIFHPEWGDTITVSSAAAPLIMERYPGKWVDTSVPQAPTVVDADGVIDPPLPPPKRR